MGENIDVDPDLGFMLAYWHLAWVNVPVDHVKALIFAILSAEAGSKKTIDLVAMLVDSHIPTDDVHGPLIEDMEWYKYPWRSPEMSENLSMGEVRRIWRLCIDHLLTERVFDAGDTDSFFRLMPYNVDVPEDLRQRVGKVCKMAGAIESRRVSRRSTSFRGPRYDIGESDTDHEHVSALIDKLKGLLERRG